MTEEPREPTEEELRAALEEQMRRITVKDVLLQTVVTLVNLSARKLGLAEGEEKDLEQARLGIDAVRALLPLMPEEEVAPVKEALSQLQMAYAQAAGGEAKPQTPHPTPQTSDEEARAKAREKIWTPPGS
ncbi:MAG TPA: hypothetical protein VN606_15610 [Thermoleophilaceae bacterium]|jgi:hypothetical protein|nr:hypothetical protein [Thermoleophilaceae bacterium]